MYKTESNLHYPVEYLIFQLEDASTIDEFIEKDHEVWTMFLKDYPAFYSKEIWVNENNPGEVHSVIMWKNMEGWKTIPVEFLKETDDLFSKAYPYKFEIVRRVHRECENGLYMYGYEGNM